LLICIISLLGKTTLLNCLANRAPYGIVDGKVEFAGRAFTASDLMYVPQFDEIKDYCTVVEQIMYVGMMKCVDVEDMKFRLLRLLQILGLFSKAQTLCKDLTGGELKRVSVGMGMIANPKVLFLDEPTTGLDSTAAFYLVKYLVALAQSTQVAVIMTIHQPAAIVFDMLQDLYLLEKGRLAYYGSIETAPGYFGQFGLVCPADYNTADFYMDTILVPPTFGEAKEWRQVYLASSLGQKMMENLKKLRDTKHTDINETIQPNAFSRFLTVSKFYLKYYITNPGYYIYRVLYLICCGVFIGTLFLNLETNTSQLTLYSGSIFFNIWTALFGAVGSTGLVAADRRQTYEQIKNGIVTPGVAVLSQFITSIPYNLLAALIFQSIFHWLTNINPRGDIFVYAIIITSQHLLLMEAIMACVVEVVKDAMLSVTLAMVFLGTLFLFPGFFIQVNDMPIWIRWMSYIIPTKVNI
jgi:ABC-type multidrug transport system ATPase subunit